MDEPDSASGTRNAEVQRLLDELRHLKRIRLPLLSLAVVMVLAGLGSALSICVTLGEAAWPWLLTPVAGMLVVFAFVTEHQACDRRRAVLWQLTAFRDKRVARELLAALDDPFYQEIHLEVRAALLEVLPLFGQGDAAPFAGIGRSLIRRHLAGLDDSLTCALLGAIERTGSIWALRDADWLSRGESESRSRVREAASRCAETLHRLVEQRRSPRQLLRPSEPSAEGDLLRPAAGEAETDGARLLRPEEGENR
jgi:hypothetical protein